MCFFLGGGGGGGGDGKGEVHPKYRGSGASPQRNVSGPQPWYHTDTTSGHVNDNGLFLSEVLLMCDHYTAAPRHIWLKLRHMHTCSC